MRAASHPHNETPGNPLTPSRDICLPAAPRRLDSRSLLGEMHEVRIDHYGQEYRLRQTRNGKLILTK